MGLEDAIARDHHRFDGLRGGGARVTLEMRVARAPDLSIARLRGAPPLPRPAGGRAGREGGRDRLAGRRSGRRRCSSAGWCAAHRSSARTRARSRTCRARYVVDRRRVRTRGSVERSAPRATGRTRRAWPSGATTRARCTTIRGSSRPSTCATGTATSLPGYGWIFPVGDGTHQRRHRAAVDLPRLEVGEHVAPHDRVGRDGAGVLGTSTTTNHGEPTGGRLPWRARWDRSRARRSSWSATRRGPSTRSTVRASTTPYETGRLAADVLDEALRTRTGWCCSATSRPSTRSSRSTSRSPGCSCSSSADPRSMRELTRVGMHSQDAHGVGAGDHGQPPASPTSSGRPRPSTRRSRRWLTTHRSRAPRLNLLVRASAPSRGR